MPRCDVVIPRAAFNLRGPNGLGAILEVTLDAKGDFVSGKVLATRQEGKGIPKHDEKGEVIDLLRSLTAEDFPATGAVVEKDGTIRPPAGVPQA